MKSFIALILALLLITVVATQPPRKGCQAYGMACFGGHGKRAIMDNTNAAINGATMGGSEQDDLPNDIGLRENNGEEIESYPPYRLMRIMKSWYNAHARRFPAERLNEFDYPTLADDTLIRDRPFN